LYRRLRDAAREMSAQAAETDVRAIPNNAIERKFVGAGMRKSESQKWAMVTVSRGE